MSLASCAHMINYKNRLISKSEVFISDFNMDNVIRDSEISSCQELEEMRQEAERAAVESVERQMGYIIQIAMDEDAEIVGERNILQMELDNEMRALNTFKQALHTNQDATRGHLQEMLDLQNQLTTVSADTANLLSSLQGLREQNHATLKADPIYALVQEERSLQQQLGEMGIYVHPSTGSDDY